MLAECRTIGRCKTGSAVITGAGNLNAKHVVHAVGPVWKGGNYGEPELLEGAYRSSFTLARKAGAKSIAFPAISTGVYGYPIKAATEIAFSVANEFIDEFEEIRFIAFSENDFAVFQEELSRGRNFSK